MKARNADRLAWAVSIVALSLPFVYTVAKTSPIREVVAMAAPKPSAKLAWDSEPNVTFQIQLKTGARWTALTYDLVVCQEVCTFTRNGLPKGMTESAVIRACRGTLCSQPSAPVANWR
jgi:hypothetical protein